MAELGLDSNNNSSSFAVTAVCVLVAQWCPTLCSRMDCSLPGSSAHGILQARILELLAISFSRGSSWPRDQTLVSCIAGRLPFELQGSPIEVTSIFNFNILDCSQKPRLERQKWRMRLFITLCIAVGRTLWDKTSNTNSLTQQRF